MPLFPMCARFNTSMLNNLPSPLLVFPPVMHVQRLRSCHLPPRLCSRVARRKGAGQGEARAQRWLMYGFWRGNTAHAMRECGNVRMARCPPGPAHSALCLEGALSSGARWAGDERGHWGAGGWTQARDQMAERQRRVAVAAVGVV